MVALLKSLKSVVASVQGVSPDPPCKRLRFCNSNSRASDSETASSDAEVESECSWGEYERDAISEPDLLVSEEEVADQFLMWKSDLAEATGQQDEVLEALLTTHVVEHAWDTGEHLLQLLIASGDDAKARATYQEAFARARLALPDPCPAQRSKPFNRPRCVVCLDAGGDLVCASSHCGHYLHRECLAAGLRSQSGADVAARCPGCPASCAAPVAVALAREALGEAAPSGREAEVQRWADIGEGSLFCKCPSGLCRIRPGDNNYTMQVVCRCAERFCCYCGETPHEPVPCAQMKELRAFLVGLRRELRERMPAAPDVSGAADADRAALLEDIERAQRANSEQEGDAPVDAVLDQSVVDSIKRDYDDLLFAKAPGALRRSAEVALVFLRSWDLQPEDAGGPAATYRGAEDVRGPGARAAAPSSEVVLEATTRPCPRCFIPIEKEGGCQHMTCTNPRCSHEFCWLCLRDWRSSTHDGLLCALSRLGSTQAGVSNTTDDNDAVGPDEALILENWEAQPEDTRPASKEEYAAEVRRRFSVALTTELKSDREMLVPFVPGEMQPPPLHLSLRLFQYYERREAMAREAAAAAFGIGPASRAQRSRCVAEVRGFVEWLRARWWLRLLPEDAMEMDFELEGSLDQELARAARMRAAHAVYQLHCRELAQARARAYESAGRRLLARLAQAVIPERDTARALALFLELAQADSVARQDEEGSAGTQSSMRSGAAAAAAAIASRHGKAPAAADRGRVLEAATPATSHQQHGYERASSRPATAARRALSLATASCEAWRASRLFELVGALPRMEGRDASCVALSADRWVCEAEQRARAVRGLLSARRDGAGGDDALEAEFRWEEELRQGMESLNAARRSVFKFALDYCGGTRRTVRRRGDR